jgi:hypothetical protein
MNDVIAGFASVVRKVLMFAFGVLVSFPALAVERSPDESNISRFTRNTVFADIDYIAEADSDGIFALGGLVRTTPIPASILSHLPHLVQENQVLGKTTGVSGHYLSDAESAGFQITPAITGSWFDQNQSGHGFALEVLPGNMMLAYWFVYAPEPLGGETWIIASGPYNGNVATLQATQEAGSGAFFPPHFSASTTKPFIWGTLTLTFSDINNAQLNYSSVVPGYGSGSLPLQRFTQPASSVFSAAANADANGSVLLNLGTLNLPLQMIDTSTQTPLAGLLVAAATDSAQPGRVLLLIGDPARKYPVQIAILESDPSGGSVAAAEHFSVGAHSVSANGVAVPVPVDSGVYQNVAPGPTPTALTRVSGAQPTSLLGTFAPPEPAPDGSDFVVLLGNAEDATFRTPGLVVPDTLSPSQGPPIVECTNPVLPPELLSDLGQDLAQAAALNQGLALIEKGSKALGYKALPELLEEGKGAEVALLIVDLTHTLQDNFKGYTYFQDSGALNVTHCQVRFGLIDFVVVVPAYVTPPSPPYHFPPFSNDGCHITDQYGIPLSQGSLQLISHDNLGVAIASVVDSTGNAGVPIDVPSGSYQLVAESPGYQSQQQNVAIGDNRQPCNIQMTPVSGPQPLTITMPNGSGQQGIAFSLAPPAVGGGVPPYTYQIANPQIPGITIDPATGIVSVSSSVMANVYVIYVCADDSANHQGCAPSTITVNAPTLPNLTPYQPSGWSDKIVVTRTSGSITDSPTILTTDTVYVDWAVINSGGTPAVPTFYTDLYLDGTRIASWPDTPPLNPTHYAYIIGFSLGKLAAGTHTLNLIADSTYVISESDPTDQMYGRSFTVETPTANSTLVWTVTDSCNNGTQLDFKFFDFATNTTWPNGDLVYYMNPGQTYTQTLSCVGGDQICLGAQSGSVIWGVGLYGQGSCTMQNTFATCGQSPFSTAFTCNSGGNGDWWYHWNCNGDAQCLATNPGGTSSGEVDEGPGSGGQTSCSELVAFAAGPGQWGSAAVDYCNQTP